MHQEDGHFRLRIPADLKAWIAEQAKRNCASQNSEIVRRLRAAFDSETKRKRQH